MPSQRTPSDISTLPLGADISEIVGVFERDGAVILSGFASDETISKITSELSLPTSTAAVSPVTALAAKSPTFVSSLLQSQKLLEFVDTQLAKTTRIWHGTERLSNTSRPQLSATVVFDSAPGTDAEPLHRHDDIYFQDHPLQQPVEVWALWAAGPTGATSTNGAVEAILGSHKWSEEWDPAGHMLATAEMQRGDCLLLHGSLVHRAGANTSDGLRRTIGASWTMGHMRQEENMYLSISREKARGLDEKTQRIIGYKINPPMGGWYELRDPITFLQDEKEVDMTMREFRDEDVQ